MMLPGWFWILTMTGAILAIGISGVTVVYLKLAELDKRLGSRRSE